MESSKNCLMVVSEGSSFFIPSTIKLKFHLYEGQNLTEEEFIKLKKEVDAHLCYEKALSLLSIREHTAWELKMKLLQRGFSTSVIDSTIIILKEENSLDEERFAEVFINSRLRKKAEGRALMEQRLMQKGLSKEKIKVALDSVYTQEKTLELAKKAYDEAKRKTADEKKVAQSMQKAGFSLKYFFIMKEDDQES